jgi:hypothetical protein
MLAENAGSTRGRSLSEVSEVRVDVMLRATQALPVCRTGPQTGGAMQILRHLILSCEDSLGFTLRREPKPLKLKDWLGGLDSNQDSQIQNLESCQLDDLPAVVRDGLGHTGLGVCAYKP